MKHLIYIIISILIISCTTEQKKAPNDIAPFITPFGEFNFKRPQFPDTSVNIINYGAIEGGEIKVTKAINKAISEMSAAGGGKVIVSKGKWLTGPIILKSNVNLYLEKGALVLFSQDFDDYLPAVLTNHEGTEAYSYSPFIYAYKQENIAITGKGVLHGQGTPWWDHRENEKNKPNYSAGKARLMEMADNDIPVEKRLYNTLENFLVPPFFQPIYCNNVLLEGITFKYGAFWTVNPNYCKNVIVRNIYILTDGEYGHTPNGDGINPNSCQNVLIEYNTLDTRDDCITIKSGKNRDGRRVGLPCKNILIRYNTGLKGHGGVVIGSETSGGVENVYAHDCEFYGTDRIIRIKTARGRGAYIRNCWFKNMKGDTIQKEAIRINMLYGRETRLPVKEINEGTPYIKNINFENINCNHTIGNIIGFYGIPEMPIQDISLKNINLGGEQGIKISDVKNIHFANLTIRNKTGSALEITYSDSIFIDSLKIEKTDMSVTPIVLTDASNINIPVISTMQEFDKLISISGNSKNNSFDNKVSKNKIEYHKE